MVSAVSVQPDVIEALFGKIRCDIFEFLDIPHLIESLPIGSLPSGSINASFFVVLILLIR